MLTRIKVGIIGFGLQGQKYASMIAEDVDIGLDLVAVSARDSNKSQLVDKRIAFFTDYRDLLRDSHVQAVIICVPHYLHPTISKEALLARKHVLVEKPAGVYAHEVREVNAISEQFPDLAYAILYNERLKPIYQYLKAELARGDLGEVRKVNWILTKNWRPESYYKQNNWRATWNGEGGGLLINQLSHQIDLLQWLFGMPTHVSAQLKYGSQRNIEADDDVSFLWRLKNGANVVMDACTHDLLGTDRLEILTDKAKILVENSSVITVKKMERNEKEWSEQIEPEKVKNIHDHISYEEEKIDFSKESVHVYKEVFKNFVKHINGIESPVAEGKEGINSVEITNALYLSDWLNKEVSLPVDANSFMLELQRKIEE
ncbi:Gfo/Idh/MocA family protein [Saliterribacillus persicus]|uniref:Putative dehydrogenase n=1 Tax=Saliterribacillus persicus TaxID=930114 RepID=A0A368YAP1_9BACI|nr:Gfo/Idh/MocA family oxidoreductase [Saliterribacillus persicus]RCW77272.1 putative dehydrogenase [Saliterribacillus persicus]